MRLLSCKSLNKYGITEYEYRELAYFCLQYSSKKKQIQSLESRTTLDNSLDKRKLELYRKDVKLIEECAYRADNFLAPYILKGVTANTPYDYLAVPCCKRVFFRARTSFFYNVI